MNIISPAVTNCNLTDFEALYKTFSWDSVYQNFSWQQTGKINIVYEAVDRHLPALANKTAFIFQGEKESQSLTYLDLSMQTNRFGNVLKKHGLKKQDRVFVFMPRRLETYIALLGAIKAGAIVGPLFEAFMTEAVKDRLLDSQAKFLVTTPELLPRVPLAELPDLGKIIVVGDDVIPGTLNYFAEMANVEDTMDIEWADFEDGYILHYTSGSTGKPKGVLHAHRAMVGHYQTGKWVLDLRPDDIYWCTADPGWVTGTAYGIFAPLLNGVTCLILGGRFNAQRWYSAIEQHKVTVWYSAPTAFRMLMSAGEDVAKSFDLSSLRHVLSVGEPLNPEVVYWGLHALGQRIHDTWWMTETGMQLICNLPSLPIKPGSMGKPLPGIYAAIIDEHGNELPPNTIGNLAIKTPWISMMSAIWNNEQKYQEYFRIKPWYLSGDVAYKDEDGYFWFQGRNDDIINTSGERVGPFEIESKLIEHPAVAEAGVIGKPDSLRGEIIKAFIALRKGFIPSEELHEEIKNFIKTSLAAHMVPKEIQFIEKLPKTRSGKIMRRVLKAMELGLPLGDLSTAED
ncbi:acetate--CoA ligase [Zhaonella formicivorans]|uniref:acetate--CoA ligase n=1 Tax=Zhaonella formicivorans TaxID=2528593 RepID=UPI001D11DAE7|nr:acetate--CoA ligase [Zhaonella formicivorans]